MTKKELEIENDRLKILLGLAFALIPSGRTKIFFERSQMLTGKKGV